MKGITKELAQWIVETNLSEIPENVCLEAKKALLNWLGVAIGACRHPSVDLVMAMANEVGGKEQASILGRGEKLNILFASLINGMTSHIFDFDDTHLETVLHPSSPVAPVVFALGECYDLSGANVLEAFILGVEAECRISQSVYPDHYESGWHITSTAGNFGAAIAAGKILGLQTQQMTYALGMAASQASGLREMFGTMTKSFHPGKAAMNGIMAAMLAAKGFTSSEQGIEAKAGFANVLSTKQDYARITQGLGKHWELLNNSYKPFACGVVAHPTMDAVIRLKQKYHIHPQDVAQIECYVHRLVPLLMGNPDPKTGLESKFSTYHSAAVSLIDGRGGEKQFNDTRVGAPDVTKLRKQVKLIVLPEIEKDEVEVKIVLKDGEVFTEHVQHALGSRANPMSMGDLKEKFSGLTKNILPVTNIDHLIHSVLNLEKMSINQTISFTKP